MPSAVSFLETAIVPRATSRGVPSRTVRPPDWQSLYIRSKKNRATTSISFGSSRYTSFNLHPVRRPHRQTRPLLPVCGTPPLLSNGCDSTGRCVSGSSPYCKVENTVKSNVFRWTMYEYVYESVRCLYRPESIHLKPDVDALSLSLSRSSVGYSFLGFVVLHARTDENRNTNH